MNIIKLISQTSQMPQKVLLSVITILLGTIAYFGQQAYQDMKEVVELQKDFIKISSELSVKVDNSEEQTSKNTGDIKDVKENISEIRTDIGIIKYHLGISK